MILSLSRLALIAIVLIGAAYVPAPASEIADVGGGCTTDSDCARQFGGNGDPEPVRSE